MRKLSVGILAFLGIAIVLISLVSANLAYRGAYPIGGVAVEAVAQGRPGLEAALRGIRGTSAAWAGAFGVLWLAVVFGPYKRGEVWSWWALLGSVLFMAVLVLLRVPLLGQTLGIQAALTVGTLAIVGLLLDAGRLKSARG